MPFLLIRLISFLEIIHFIVWNVFIRIRVLGGFRLDDFLFIIGLIVHAFLVRFFIALILSFFVFISDCIFNFSCGMALFARKILYYDLLSFLYLLCHSMIIDFQPMINLIKFSFLLIAIKIVFRTFNWYNYRYI